MDEAAETGTLRVELELPPGLVTRVFRHVPMGTQALTRFVIRALQNELAALAILDRRLDTLGVKERPPTDEDQA